MNCTNCRCDHRYNTDANEICSLSFIKKIDIVNWAIQFPATLGDGANAAFKLSKVGGGAAVKLMLLEN
jgi:hypothetical protein